MKNFEKITEWLGIEVIHKEHSNSMFVNAFYRKATDQICICKRFFTKTLHEQESILDHEAGHKLWYRLPRFIQVLWILYHTGEKDFMGEIKNLLGYEYTEVNYLNSNAERTERESFCEFIELMTLDRLSGKETVFKKTDPLYLGYEMVKRIMAMVDTGKIKLNDL